MYSAVELLLSESEKDTFSTLPGQPEKFNPNECLIVCNHQNDTNLITKSADKGTQL